MNRKTAAGANSLFLSLVVAGAGFAMIKDRVRGWLVDLKYFSGIESAHHRDHEDAVQSFRDAAELALMEGSRRIPGFNLDTWIGPKLPLRASKALFEAGRVLEENLEDFQAAEEAYRRSAELAGEDEEARRESEARLAEVADRASRSKAVKDEGKRLLDEGEFRAAQASFEKAVRLDPGDREARYLLKVALASGRPSVGKAQAAELLHLSLRARGFEGARVQYAPFWAHGSGAAREALILDVPQAGLRIPELLLPCAEAAGRILDLKLSFDLGRVVIRRHPGREIRPPTFAAFRNDEIFDIPVDTLRQFRMGQMTPAELVRRLAPPSG